MKNKIFQKNELPHFNISQIDNLMYSCTPIPSKYFSNLKPYILKQIANSEQFKIYVKLSALSFIEREIWTEGTQNNNKLNHKDIQ